MGVVVDLRLRARWTWHRATFVARTEGLGALVARGAAAAGLGKRYVEPQERLVAPPRAPLSAETARRWPISLIVLGDGGRARELAGLAQSCDVPADGCSPADRDCLSALQCASVLVVAGVANWPPPAVLAEARRLRLAIVLDMSADDLGLEGFRTAARSSRIVMVDSGQTAESVAAQIRPAPELHVLPRGDERSGRASLAELLAHLDEAGP